MIGLGIGQRRGGIGLRLGGGIAAGWSVDSLGGKAVAADVVEWQSFIDANSLDFDTPDSLFLCQESSGDLVDVINGVVLTANAAPLYQQSVAGWSRKAVGFSEVANQRFQNVAFNDIAASSLLVLMYMFHTQSSASTAGTLCGGTSPSAPGLSQLTGTTRTRYRNGANIVDSANSYTSVVPVVFKHDIANSAARVYTDAEKLSPTYAAASGTTFGIGGAGSGGSSRAHVLYMAVWTGAKAEKSDATVKAVLQAAGWSIAWS